MQYSSLKHCIVLHNIVFFLKGPILRGISGQISRP